MRHSFLQSIPPFMLRAGMLAAALSVAGTASADLFVSSSGTNSVKRFDMNGTYLGDFVAPGAGGLTNPQGIAFGPDGNLYVSSVGTGTNPKHVLRFNGQTGQFIDVFTKGTTFSFPADMAFRPDGFLYVSDFRPGGQVKRFNATTGQFVSNFVSNLASPDGLSWDLSGNLYISQFGNGAILRVNGSTGASMGTFATGATNALDSRFGADGHLYVNSFTTNKVKKYNGSTGAFMGDFINVGNGTQGQAIGPDGLLYVGGYGAPSFINKYDPNTGALVGTFANNAGSGLAAPNNFCFTPESNATFLSQTVPASLIAGQRNSVSIKMRNDGTDLWSRNGGFRLTAMNPQGNTTWGGSQVFMNTAETYEPGRIKDWKFDVIPPEVPGTYNFQWQMSKEGLGLIGTLTPNIEANVVKLDKAARYISQVPPPNTMVAGTTANVSITMRNVGNFTWTPEGKYYLGSRTPLDNFYWGSRRIGMAPGSSAPPNTDYTFNKTVTAPWAAGTYTFQWKMLNASGWFGDFTAARTVTITPAANAGTFVSQSGIPTTVAPGGTFTASVTMKNTGTVAWTTATNFRLGSWNSVNNTTWGVNRWELPAGANVAPNANVTFTRTFTAPTTPGTYNFQWRMIKSGVAYFGETSMNVPIVVQ